MTNGVRHQGIQHLWMREPGAMGMWTEEVGARFGWAVRELHGGRRHHVSHSLVDESRGTGPLALHWPPWDAPGHSGEQGQAVFELTKLRFYQDMQVLNQGLQE